MKRLVFSIVTLAFLNVSAFAGVAWIDVSTGEFQCTNGYKGYQSVCDRKSSNFLANYCRQAVFKICNN